MTSGRLSPQAENTSCTNSRAADDGTYTSSGLMQAWPAFCNRAAAIRDAARRSASRRPTSSWETTTGFLPPSSSVTGVRVRAAAAITLLPTSAEPVKNRWSRSSAANSLLTSASPVTTATSSTSKASCSALASTSAVRGTFSDILIMTRLPAASAVSAGIAVRLSGKFHMPMTPTTPSGLGTTSARSPASRDTAPTTRPPAGRGRIQRATFARWISASAANATTSLTSVTISPR